MSSYWIESVKDLKNFDKIRCDYTCDVCIIGAGITGLSLGYYLSKAGLKVIIIEKDFMFGQKTSGNTTAKITYGHNLIYDYLIKSYGIEFAYSYLQANKSAIENIKNIIDTENIDCDFEYQSNYIYTTKQDELNLINSEISALAKLGEDCDFVTSCGLPFKICGAIEEKNQAQFNPEKYMKGLADTILKNGGLIFCNSTATDFMRQEDHYITFVNNNNIKSKNIVVASHYPFKKLTRILLY